MSEEGYTESKHFSRFIKLKKFYSRKNSVYLVRRKKEDQQKLYVLKVYHGVDKLKRKRNEEFFLTGLKKSLINVPEIFSSDEDCLLMEYLEDATLLDILVESEINSSNNIEPFYRTLNIINRFNLQASGLKGESYILKDMNLRNFIYKDKKIWRIDLEDSSLGAIEEDYGRLLAFILTYDPVFTEWKMSKVKILLDSISIKYKVDFDLIVSEMKKELSSIEERRRLKIPFEKINVYFAREDKVFS